MHHSSYVEISRSAYRRNMNFLQQYIGAATRISSVIKGNAYGHGIEVFLPMAEDCGVHHFSVFSAEEALLADGCRKPDTDLLIMGYIDDAELEWAIDREIAFYIFDLDRLTSALSAARRLNKPARIHLELETGMNRTGLGGEELDAALELLRKHAERVRIEGACTHLAGAESIANYYRIHQQLETFTQLCDVLEQQGWTYPIRHAAGSGAALNYPRSRLDLVRIGIAQYGYWPNQETHMNYAKNASPANHKRAHDPLRGILRWRSQIMSLKQVSRGDFVGYGTAYQAMRNQTIAAVPVGYAHGFARTLSNLGHVLVRGRRAPVIGYVNMNMMMVDVTDCPGVERGDEVVLIGKQGRARITVRSFSDLSNYVNYEILVNIPATIPRRVVA